MAKKQLPPEWLASIRLSRRIWSVRLLHWWWRFPCFRFKRGVRNL